MSRHVYSTDFYDYIDTGSRASARTISTLLLREKRIESLHDVGSGHGAWTAEWLRSGVADIVGVDGAYVEASQLAIAPERFVAHDLTHPLDLGRRFDLVQSVEVAEHLSADHAGVFVDNLLRHGDVILFFRGGSSPARRGACRRRSSMPAYRTGNPCRLAAIWRGRFAVPRCG